MKTLLTLTFLFFLFNSYSQTEESRTVISRGDTLEMTKEVRNEYVFQETLSGLIIKVDGIKYLIVENISGRSKHYVFEVPNNKIAENEVIIDTTSVVTKSILAVDNDYKLRVAGMYLEDAGNLKNGAIATSILTISAGLTMVLLSDSQQIDDVGYVIIGVGQLTSFIMNIVANNKITKAGGVLRKEKLKL